MNTIPQLHRKSAACCFLAKFLMIASSGCLHAGLIHQWTFNNPVGQAIDGTLVPDLAGGASFTARVVGPGAVFTGTAVRLPGGSSNTAPYIDLPNNLLNSRQAVSIEAWYTVHGPSTAGGGFFTRIFDFGTGQAGEVSGTGGTFEGTNYLFLSAAAGNNYNAHVLEIRGMPGANGATLWQRDRPASFGQQIHIVVTLNSSSGQTIVNYWRNGEHLVVNGASSFRHSDIVDVNNWLGRSNWSADTNLNGEINEFRIYDNALTPQEVAASRASGPTAFIPSSSRTSAALPGHPGSGARIELFDKLGGNATPQQADLVGHDPTGVIFSPELDFPKPGEVFAVGAGFDAFFHGTALPPMEAMVGSATNFTLRTTADLRVDASLDTSPQTPGIQVSLGIGSDDGYNLTVGGQQVGSAPPRPFSYSWHDVTFESEGLYPVSLLYSSNMVGDSGLELAWRTGPTPVVGIVPRQAFYNEGSSPSAAFPLELNATVTETIDAPYRSHHWSFAGEAGQKVRLVVPEEHRMQPIAFTLRGPSGWMAFENRIRSSGVITLPSTGTFTVAAQSLMNTAAQEYSFLVLDARQSNLAVFATDFTEDPSAPDLPSDETIAISTSAPPRAAWQNLGGFPGGYLKLTDDISSQSATAVFPAFSNGFFPSAFTFEADCRLVSSATTVGDGFSFNFLNADHPVVTQGALVTEEGLDEGLSVCFDAFDNDGSGENDAIGLEIKVDGVVLARHAMPFLHGAADNPDSIQTGTPSSPGWARLRIEMRPDTSLDVFWKGAKIIDNLVTGVAPGSSRFALAARTGTHRETHHFDNVAITAAGASLNERTLILNQRMNGTIENAFGGERWSFSAAAGRQVRLDVLNTTAPGLAYALMGPEGWVGFGGQRGDSDLVTLPVTGEYFLTVFGNGSNPTVSYAFQLDETSQTELSVGTEFTGQLSGGGEARLFRFEVAESGPLDLAFLNAGAGNRVEVYASRNAPPTRGSFEYSDASGPGASRSLDVPHAPPGVWYVLVYADQVPAPGAFSILASTPGVAVTHVTPAKHSANVSFSLTVSGAGFSPGMNVELVPASGPVLSAAVSLDSFTRLTASFAASGAAPGLYSLRVRQADGDTATLAGAFEILAPGEPKLETRLIMPGALGRHAVATIYVEYANTGNAAMPAPLLILKGSDPDGSDRPILTMDQSRVIQDFWSGTEGLPPGTSHEALILASGAQPGVLNPGERFQVPVYYIGLLQPWDFGDNNVEMEIRYWTADNPAPIDWAPQKNQLRPPTLEPAVWDIVFSNLTGELATTAAYVAMLNDNAVFLGRLGQRVVDVGDLWNFELQQAYGFSPLPVIDSVTDAAVASPGTPLSIDRRFSSNLRSRWDSGPFGRGWFTPWQTRLVSESGGAVVRIIGEGGSARVFSRDIRNGSYFSGAGDSSKLSAAGGGFELRVPDGSVTRFTSNGRIGNVEDANGNRVTASYESGRLSGLAHTSGSSLAISYNEAGFICGITESTGRSVTYTYSGGYLETATTDDGKATTYTYQTSGLASRLHALTSINRAGVTRSFAWDTRGRLASSAVAGGEQVLNFGYDSAGGVTASDAFGSTSFHFDHRGLLAKTVDPLGNITASEYDEDLRLKRLLLPSGDSRGFTWCSCGSPATITDELGYTTRFRYEHPLKRMTAFTDAKGNRTRYSYDAKGNLLATTYANDSVEYFAGYNASGLPGSKTNRRGQTSTFTYTPSGKIARRVLAEGDIADFDYDARGNLIRVTEQPLTGPQKVTTYDYVPAVDGDRLKKVNYPNDRWVEYAYDTEGRRSRIFDSAGGDTRYEYDTAGRLWKLRDAADVVIVEYLYDAAGKLLRINKGNGTYTTYQYDAAGQILLLVNHAPDGTPNSSFGYTYDARGRRTRMETLDGTWTYAYDSTGQLIHAVLDSTSPEIPDQDLRYHYDALGNRTSTVINGIATAYTTNSLNQYTTIGGILHQHDIDGNLISDGVREYFYDSSDRLIQISRPEGIMQYDYDCFGNRIATILGGERSEYLLDLTGTINVLEKTSSDSESTRWTHGIGLTTRCTGDHKNPIHSYYNYDITGSVAETSSEGGSIEDRYSYYPFGELIHLPLSSSGTFRQFAQFGITSEEAGLSFARARFFSTSRGRFNSEDRALSDINFYRYGHNNPISLVDFNGLWSVETGGFAAYGVGVYLGGSINPDTGKRTVTIGVGTGYGAGASVGPTTNSGSTGPGFLVTGGGLLGGSISLGPEREVAAGLSGAVGGLGIFAGGTLTFCTAYCQDGDLVAPQWLLDEIPDGGGPGSQGTTGDSAAAGAIDPNEKLGPSGYGSQAWVSAASSLPYRIHFENLGPGSKDPAGNPYPNPATAPAQRVIVTDPLSASLDWETFRFTEFGFGDTIVPVTDGSSHFSGSVPMTYNDQTFDVEIEAGIDFSTGVVSIRFQSIDAETSLPPDVLSGFLPPEDGTGRGKGHVAFLVRPKTGLPNGTAIRNVASIRFDINDPITTNQIDPQDASQGTDLAKEALVTLDDGPPSCAVLPLPPSSEETQIDVRWAGDDRGGVGIRSYDVHVSVNGEPFTLWLDDTTLTQASYPGYFGQHLAFHAVATDFLGQEPSQIFAPGGQASTVIVDDDYLGWRGERFGAAVGNPALRNSLWSDDADPDGDGLTNLFEFLAATNPLQRDAGLAGSLRLEGGRAIFSHQQTPVTKHLVDHYVEWSPDLQRWYTGGILYNLIEDSGDHLKLEAHITTHGMKRVFFRRVATRKVIYAHWIYEEGVPFQDRGADLDPNGDGITNSMAYGFGLPAMGAVPPEDLSRLPEEVMVQIPVRLEDGTEILEDWAGLEFSLPAPGPEDVTLAVESSPPSSPNSWREAARKVGRNHWIASDAQNTRIITVPGGATQRHTVIERYEGPRSYRVRAVIHE